MQHNLNIWDKLNEKIKNFIQQNSYNFFRKLLVEIILLNNALNCILVKICPIKLQLVKERSTFNYSKYQIELNY